MHLEKTGSIHTCSRADREGYVVYARARGPAPPPQPDTVTQKCGLGIALPATFQNSEIYIVMGDAQMFKCGQLAPCYCAGHRAHFGRTAAGLQLVISVVIPLGLDQSAARNSRIPGNRFSNATCKSLVLGRVPGLVKSRRRHFPESPKICKFSFMSVNSKVIGSCVLPDWLLLQSRLILIWALAV